MQLFNYFKTKKYQNYQRNKEIFNESSTGVFRSEVTSRVKLEFMGSGAIVQGSSVFSGFAGGQPQYTTIDNLIVPSNILSAAASAYITYATGGTVLFNGKGDAYLLSKVKQALKEQSIGGSCLLRRAEDGGRTYINIYNAQSYFVEYDEFIQDKVKSYNIFNVVDENEESKTYRVESHTEGMIAYRDIVVNKKEGGITYIDTDIQGLQQAEDENGIYSIEFTEGLSVAEVQNTVFNGESDFTDDNVALLRELVVANTIASQTFDKIANPLLALPEEALEYDENGNAKVNLRDRVVVIRDGGNKPEQISLESKIEQTQVARENHINDIYSSLAVNKVALGITDISQLSAIALKRMMASTISRVEEKRQEVAKAFNELLDIEITFDAIVIETLEEKMAGVKPAIDAGVMSTEKGASVIGNEEDIPTIKAEREAILTTYDGFAADDQV